MEFTGYWEAKTTGGEFQKIDQCVRCRMIDRKNPESPAVRFNPKDPYAK